MDINKILPLGSKRRELAKKVYSTIFGEYTEEEKIYKKWIEQNEPNKQ